MTDILDLPSTITFKLGRKDILRRLWSIYFSKGIATAVDHLHYFALDAAASLPENQVACYEAKTKKAFLPQTNPKKLQNGGHNFLDPDFYGDWYVASKSLNKAIECRKAKYASLPHAGGFLALAYNSISPEVLERAAELARHPRAR